jgi:hypothetical protein
LRCFGMTQNSFPWITVTCLVQSDVLHSAGEQSPPVDSNSITMTWACYRRLRLV